MVTGYEDIRRVALDDATFSSAETILIPPKKNAAQKSIPIEMDAPEFLEYRKIMQPLFAPPAVERLAPVIEYYANHCIDEFIERGEVDVVHDFADPVPVMVTLHKLGMPIDDWRRYAEPMHKTVFLRQDNPARAGVLEELAWIAGTIKDAIQQRRQSPRDDMITYLLNSRPFGEPVSDHDAQEMIMLTMQGGFDTTGSAISSALLHLDRNRDDRRRLIEQPELMESAVEEFLRVGAPQFALARTAKRDVELGGHQIAEGDRVLLVWASGNRDESVFERPDDVAPGSRSESPHGVRARRPPLSRFDVGAAPDPGRADARSCAACPTTRSTTRGSCGRRRSVSRTARSRCRSRSRPDERILA